ncbi:MAG: M23 family metallopeptidase, partial [Algicola sp.]|nr:M23 family metallopeptidase [Algicola sp.]
FVSTAATESLAQLLQHGQGNEQAQSFNQNRQKALSKLTRLVATHDKLFSQTPLNFGKEVYSDLSVLAGKAVEAGEGGDIKAQAVNISLQLPWSLGYSWIGGGSHGYDGSSWPHSSIDFAYDWPSWGAQTWSVRSAHGGTVSVLSSCQVRITNSSGWATTYYHLSGVNVYNGQQVGANTYLGNYANNKSQALCEGGSSTGPHLHFSLLKNGYYYSLDNVSLSNYVVNTGRYSYDSNCSYFNFTNNNNSGRRLCGWNSMYNYNPY